MRIRGEKPQGPNVEIVAFQRSNSRDLVFQVGAVLDFAEFDAVYKEPQPPKMVRKDGIKSLDFDDRDYKEAVKKYHSDKMSWMILKSLAFTEELEWETVKMADPTTWQNYRQELKEAGLTPTQITHLLNQAYLVNSIDEDKMAQARASFLAARQQAPPVS